MRLIKRWFVNEKSRSFWIVETTPSPVQPKPHMKTKIVSDPLALTAEELRTAAFFARRGRRHKEQLDSALGETVRESLWRRREDFSSDGSKQLFAMYIAARGAETRQQLCDKDELLRQNRENSLIDILGDFPPSRPFHEMPPSAGTSPHFGSVAAQGAESVANGEQPEPPQNC